MNTGTDPTANYDDLTSDSIDAIAEAGTSSSPTIIQQALANHNFNSHAGPNYSLIVMPINTMAPPFSNQLAREALDYCLDRTLLANTITAGYASPAWVFGGPAVFWYPQDPKTHKSSIAEAQKLMPYQFNPAQGTQIVNSIGGLTFTFSVLDLSSTYITIATAMAQQWTQNCGIKVNIASIAPSVYNSNITAGSYQAGLNPTGAQFDPRLVVTYINPTSTLDAFGFRDQVVTNALTKSFADTTTKALTSDWDTLWSQMDKDAVLLPILSGPSYEITNKCMANIQYNYGVNFQNTYLTCKP
jgi:peptide/nickel transport system substrate-binding protein